MSRKGKLAGAVAVFAVALAVVVGTGARNRLPVPSPGQLGPDPDQPGPVPAGQPSPTQPASSGKRAPGAAAPAGPGGDQRTGTLPRFVAGPAAQEYALASGASEGTMNAEDVRTSLTSALPAVKACYDKQLQRDPRLAGRLVVQFTVVERDGAGRISEATILPDPTGDGGPELVSPVTEHCVLTALAETRFKAPVGGPVEVTFPFVFTASDDEPARR